MSKPKWYKVTYMVQWGTGKEKLPAKIDNILADSTEQATNQVEKIMRINPLNHWPQVSDLKAEEIKTPGINRCPGRGVG
jgi:hypothetical protein